MTHSLAAIGGGYVWPDVTIHSDGEQVFVQARPTTGKTWEPIRYMEHWDCKLSVVEFEEAVESFVDIVLRRLASYQIERTELHLLWQELSSERLDPTVASVRRLEALMGLDAGAAPDALVDQLLTNADQEGRTAIDEVVAEFGTAAPDILREVSDSLNDHGLQLDSSAVKELGRTRESWNIMAPPWERGEAAARKARSIWGLDGGPVSNDSLARLVGADAGLIIGWSYAGRVPMPAARWNTHERNTWSAVLRSRWKEGRRFDLSRLIADAVVAPEGELLMPATHAKTSRQKFQRAFAHEFLCPFDALVKQLGSLPPEEEEIENAARYFEVSPLLVRSKLANQGILPRF
jgi:hypothetical protein